MRLLIGTNVSDESAAFICGVEGQGMQSKIVLKYRDGRTVLPFRILHHFRFRNILVYGEDGRSSFPRNDKPNYQTTRRHTSKFPQMVTLLICIREVRGSNLGLDADISV